LSSKEMQDIRGKDIAMIFQDPFACLHPMHRVGDQIVEAILVHADISKKQAERQAVELLREVGIPRAGDRFKDFPHQFSGGMRQRVMIAMALVHSPSVLIADEPTTALDATIEREVLDLLRRLREDMGMSLLLVSHDLDVIAWSCDRAYVMYQGRVMESAPVAVLLGDPRHPYTDALISSSRLVRASDGPGAVVSDRVRPALEANGCPFAPRCPRAQPVCEETFPERQKSGPGHDYWCHNPIPVPTPARGDGD
jgi:oligopeptide/dipeptide ABC transporter ATP-binding protein